MANTHGVYVSETPTQITAPIASDSAIQVAIGTAPSNMVDSPAINTPILANSYAEAVEKLGWSKDFKSFTLCQVIRASFQVFNVKPVVFINVLDPVKHRTAVPASEQSVIHGTVVLSDFGVLLDTIVVKSQDNSTTYNPESDYIAAFDEDGKVNVNILPDGTIPPAVIKLSVSYSKVDPTKVTADDIIGGYDAANAKYYGIECVSQVYPRLGILPGILTAPGWSQIPAVAMSLVGKTTNLNGSFKCVTYVDIDSAPGSAPSYDKVKAWKDENSYTDIQMYALWPKAVIADQTFYMSALAAALTAQTDTANANVPSRSPSNNLLRITGLVNEAGEEIYLDQPQANFVNDGGVATALNRNGWELWGNRTAAYPGNTDPKDFWLNMRRVFSWDCNNTVLSFANSVDAALSHRLIQMVVDVKNMQGNGYVAAGQLAAYRCEYFPDENPITDIINGIVKFHIYISPYPPAETLIFTQEFDPNALENALGGGS